MKKINLLVLAILILLALLALFLVKPIKKTEEKMPVNMINITNVTNISLITVYDNYQHNSELKTGFGFGCVIKTKDKNILFDTGSESLTLIGNMEKLGIKPEEINIIVLSHIHGDHVGGLLGFLEKNSNVTVFILDSFPKSFKNEIKQMGALIVEVNKEIEIEKGIYSTGELGILIKEQSLIINTKKGLVIVTGCAHPGIINIIKRAKELTNKEVYLVIGGFHLSGASDSELKNIIESFREIHVKKVAPCHCSGDRCRELFKQEYKNDFISNGVGKIIEI